MEFQSLGPHQRDRRRIIAFRVDHRGQQIKDEKDQNVILKMPFLLFADETVEDTDEILLPIIHEIMMQNAVSE